MSKTNTTNETASPHEGHIFPTSLWVSGSLLLSLVLLLGCVALSSSPLFHQVFPNLFWPMLLAWCAYLLVGGLLLGLQGSQTRVRDGVRLLAAGMPLYVLVVWCGFSLNARIGAPSLSMPASAPVECPAQIATLPTPSATEEADTDPAEEVDQFLLRLHTPTPSILKLAAQITDDTDDQHAAALRAIAERRFDDAEAALKQWAAEDTCPSDEENRTASIASLRAEAAFYAGHYAEAIHQFRSALEADADNPLLLNGLACSLEAYGQYPEAEKVFKKAITHAKEIWGGDDQDTLSFIAGLGALYSEMGRYAEAQVLLEQARDGREKILDENDSDMALSLNALGNLYERTERYEEAEALYQRALAIQEKAFGIAFPDTANTRENLAVLYDDMGRYEEAEQLCRKSVQALEAYYGTGHPDMAYSYTNLGVIRHDRNDYAEAERLYLKALNLDRQTLASSAPNLATDYHNLGVLYDNQSRYSEAEAAYKQALNIYEQALGANSPVLVTTLDCLASMYSEQDRYVPALAGYRRALAITETASGPNSADLVSELNNCATILRNLGRDAEAAQMEARSQRIRPTDDDTH